MHPKVDVCHITYQLTNKLDCIRISRAPQITVSVLLLGFFPCLAIIFLFNLENLHILSYLFRSKLQTKVGDNCFKLGDFLKTSCVDFTYKIHTF